MSGKLRLGQKSRQSFNEKHRALAKAECALPNIVESPAWPKNPAEPRLAQNSWRSFGGWHRASTKAECAPPNIVESPAWVKSRVMMAARGIPLRLSCLFRKSTVCQYGLD
ncbi:hypothetical protein C8J57DRAFT_1242926 [Mycena rebaudengoi]|nr:hypothetical protein C8J57DRAFT_1242926 [Mycena rebaudengoi]